VCSTHSATIVVATDIVKSKNVGDQDLRSGRK
jgi:hypothetical protein